MVSLALYRLLHHILINMEPINADTLASLDSLASPHIIGLPGIQLVYWPPWHPDHLYKLLRHQNVCIDSLASSSAI